MNAERRKRLKEAINHLDQARSIIEGIKDEEQESFDNLPEGAQSAERGEKMESAISELEEALTSLEDTQAHIDEATQ